jgi:hypothetical protein
MDDGSHPVRFRARRIRLYSPGVCRRKVRRVGLYFVLVLYLYADC